jgi:glycosyl-4,4'-diaponeurosporenoate acyltransferase
VVHSVTGYCVHRIPTGSPILARDGWWSRPARWERDGRVYERRLRIKRWKDRVPEAGAWFAGGVSKRSLAGRDADGLARFVVETRRAELGHWAAAAASPLFALWNPPGVAAVMVAYGLAANLPFIAIQRYNRARLERLLGRGLAARSAPGTAAPEVAGIID